MQQYPTGHARVIRGLLINLHAFCYVTNYDKQDTVPLHHLLLLLLLWGGTAGLGREDEVALACDLCSATQ